MRLPDAFRAPAHGEPLVFGHRGAAGIEPENTPRSFRRALADGADGVECDVHRAAGGEVVVTHDPTLERVAGDPRRVNDVTLAVLRTLDVGKGERVPLLDEVLDLVRGEDRLVNVEVKADFDDRAELARAVARVLRRRSATHLEGVMLSTFHPHLFLHLRAELPRIPVALLVGDDRRGRVMRLVGARLLRPACLNPRFTVVTPERVLRWRERGAGVHVWTVDDPHEARRLAHAGVDAIITNDPGMLREALAEP